MSAIYNSMQKLINKRFYAGADEAQAKIDVFYACDRITDDEFIELTMLVEEIYAE